MKHVTAVGASLRRSIQSREDFGRLEHAPPLALVNQADNTFGKQIVEGGVGCRLRNSQAFDGLLYGQYRMPQQESRQATRGGMRTISPELALPPLVQGDQILGNGDRFVARLHHTSYQQLDPRPPIPAQLLSEDLLLGILCFRNFTYL